MSRRGVPPEFTHLISEKSIPWESIIKASKKKTKKTSFEAFTDAAISFASKETMNDEPNPMIITLGVEACLDRGRMEEAVFLSADSMDPSVLGLRAMALFAISDTEGLRDTLSSMQIKVDEKSLPSDQVRLSTVKVLLAAAERDTSVIMCVMEFDSLLEMHPEQVEEPLTETMFTLYVVGSLLREVGEAKRAERIADTLEEMAKSKGHRMYLAIVENLRGNINLFTGDYAKAEKHYQNYLKMSEELSNKLGMAMALNNLGTLKLSSLMLEEALEHLEEANALMDMDAAKISSLANLGQLCTTLGQFEQAEDYLKEAVKLERRIGRGVVEVFAWYTILLSRIDRHSEAAEYLERTRKLVEGSEKPIQRGSYLVARAAYESSLSDTKKAASTLEELLKFAKDNNLFEMLVEAELELARTHLTIYRTSKNSEELSKAAYHLDDLIQIAKDQGLLHLTAEALLLRSDILLIGGQESEARSDLDRANGIATSVEDPRLLHEVKHRKARVAEPANVPRVLNEVAFEKSIERVSGFKPARNLVEIPMPSMHMLLVLDRRSGLTEYVHYFDQKLEMDSTMVSGFISAISSFTGEFMGGTGLLRSINHEGSTIMLEHTKPRIVAMIVENETFDIRYLLHEFAEKFNEVFPVAEERDGIAPDDYKGAEKIVKDLFLDKRLPSSNP
ncbi:MAG: tetratricopeptide repeat protein [Candidatus Thorarchaeota archaeon]